MIQVPPGARRLDSFECVGCWREIWPMDFDIARVDSMLIPGSGSVYFLVLPFVGLVEKRRLAPLACPHCGHKEFTIRERGKFDA